MNKKMYKVLIFTLLVFCAIITSSFNKSHSKYMKDEKSLVYNLTVERLNMSKLKKVSTVTDIGEYQANINRNLSNYEYGYIEFYFKKSGNAKASESDTYTYSISGTNCKNYQDIKDSDNLKQLIIKCDMSEIYDSETDLYYLPRIDIYENINKEGLFNYGYISGFVIQGIDYAYSPSPSMNIDDNILTIHKDYTDDDNHNINYFVKNFLTGYTNQNEDFFTYAAKIKKYFEAYIINDNDAINKTLKGLNRTLNNDIYTFTINEDIIAYAMTYDNFDKGNKFIYLSDTGNNLNELLYGISLRYSGSDYQDIVDYINNNGGIVGIKSSSVSGLTYVSDTNQIMISESLLDFVHPTGKTKVILKSDMGVMYGLYYDFINSLSYESGLKQLMGYDLDVVYSLADNGVYTRYHNYSYNGTNVLVIISSDNTNVNIEVVDLTSTNNVINLTNVSYNSSSYGKGIITGTLNGDTVSLYLDGLTSLTNYNGTNYSIIITGSDATITYEEE